MISLKQIVKSDLLDNCHNLTKVCRKLMEMSSSHDSSHMKLVYHLYNETFNLFLEVCKLESPNCLLKPQNYYISQKVENLVVRHSMIIGTLLEPECDNALHLPKDFDVFIQKHIKLSILIQHINDSMKDIVGTIHSVKHHCISPIDMKFMCEDVASEAANLAELSYLITPEIKIKKSPPSDNNTSAMNQDKLLHDHVTVPSVIRFILFEGIKNAVYSTIKQYQLQQLLNTPSQSFIVSNISNSSPNSLSSQIPSSNMKNTHELYRHYHVKPCSPDEEDNLNLRPIHVNYHYQPISHSYDVQIQDHGTGISAEDLSTCTSFTRYQSKWKKSQAILNTQLSYQPMTSPLQGLGVGLFLTYQYLQVMGGNMSINSAGLGEGATVKYTFPLIDLKSS